MRYLVAALILVISSFSIAQVGINTTDPQAALDISTSLQPNAVDGVILPIRSELPIGMTQAQDGMLLFIDGTDAVEQGYYVYDGVLEKWQALATTETDQSEVTSITAPDGFENFQPVSFFSTYQVPPGKNLYVTQFIAGVSTNLLVHNGTAIASGPMNMDNYMGLALPLIFGPGDVVQVTGNAIGYIVDARVTTVTAVSTYTVPANKTLVILSVSGNFSGSPTTVRINNIVMYDSFGNMRRAIDVSNANLQHYIGLQQPLFAPAGSVVTATANGSFQGYLMDNQ